MTEPHPKFIKAYTDHYLKKRTTELRAFFQSILDGFAPEVLVAYPDACAMYSTVQAMQAMDENALFRYGYEFDSSKQNTITFTICFDEYFYEQATEQPYVKTPVVVLSAAAHSRALLIKTDLSDAMISAFVNSLDVKTTGLNDMTSIVAHYLRQLAPWSPANIEGAFLDGAVRQFTLTTQHCHHTVLLNTEHIQHTIDLITDRFKKKQNRWPVSPVDQ